MERKEFFFDLPEHLIAQFPQADRSASRLMVLDRTTGNTQHAAVAELPQFLTEPALVIFNNTKVRKARIYGKTPSSKKLQEFLLIRRISPRFWKVIAPNMMRQRKGKRFIFPGGLEGEILEEGENDRTMEFSFPFDDVYLDQHGHVPLPPYIQRPDTSIDAERYQTVFAKNIGSIASPTAGLHFTAELLAQLRAQGHSFEYITLHVGLGTFLPVRTDQIEDHRMFEEDFCIEEKHAASIEEAKRNKKKILCVGTTVLRALESAWDGTKLKTGWQSTKLFIYPGFQFQIADSLFTNFHVPESTLLMLVCAFAGKEKIFTSYQDAIRKEYRFYSYGDAMLIH